MMTLDVHINPHTVRVCDNIYIWCHSMLYIHTRTKEQKCY